MPDSADVGFGWASQCFVPMEDQKREKKKTLMFCRVYTEITEIKKLLNPLGSAGNPKTLDDEGSIPIPILRHPLGWVILPVY